MRGEAMHLAVHSDDKFRRACDGRRRMRRPNEDTDTALFDDVSCIRCQRTRAWRDAAKEVAA